MGSDDDDNRSSLRKKYKATYGSAILDLSLHMTILFGLLWGMWRCKNPIIRSVLILILSCMFMRTFIVFHDCVHRSYIPNRMLCRIIGTILGVFVLTPFCFGTTHTDHHATLGCNDCNDKTETEFNEFVPHTVNQYKKWSRPIRWLYRLFKSPFVLFGVFPSIYFWIIRRFNVILEKFQYPTKYSEPLSDICFDTTGTTIGISIMCWVLYRLNILFEYIVASMIGSSIAFFIFFNQHTFNDPKTKKCYVVQSDQWRRGAWRTLDSSLIGSSIIQIPWFLRYFSCGGEYHHVHHMDTNIPARFMKRYHEEMMKTEADQFSGVGGVTELSFSECFQNLNLTLFDESKQRYVTFEEADSAVER